MERSFHRPGTVKENVLEIIVIRKKIVIGRSHLQKKSESAKKIAIGASLFMTFPTKVITHHFILRRNPGVVNGHVKSFLEMYCPYLSHTPSMYITENNFKYCI